MDSFSHMPNAEKLLTQWLGSNSKFTPDLVKQHVSEVSDIVQKCQRTGDPVLDPCGHTGSYTCRCTRSILYTFIDTLKDRIDCGRLLEQF